jgi:hypothetical protein
MGKAAVDLPDPLGPSDLPTSAQADDLLSQLAGEQIDQLLHEAPPRIEGPTVVHREVVVEKDVEPAIESRAPLVVSDEVVERDALFEVLDPVVEAEKLPPALRPLEWMNAPFGTESRGTLGKLRCCY